MSQVNPLRVDAAPAMPAPANQAPRMGSRGLLLGVGAATMVLIILALTVIARSGRTSDAAASQYRGPASTVAAPVLPTPQATTAPAPPPTPQPTVTSSAPPPPAVPTTVITHCVWTDTPSGLHDQTCSTQYGR